MPVLLLLHRLQPRRRRQWIRYMQMSLQTHFLPKGGDFSIHGLLIL
jgi:truncated hemoglobin YjbI